MKRIFLRTLSLAVVAMVLYHLGIGRHDLKAYWIGVQLFLQGADPYDLALHKNLASKALGTNTDLQLWNPPWIFPILTPLCVWPFEVSVYLLHFISLMLVWFLVEIFTSISNEQESCKSLALLILAIVFPPVVLNLIIGQFGVLVAFGVFAGLVLFWRGYDKTAGLLFLVAMIKPHGWYLLFGLIGLHAIVHKRWGVVGVGIGGLLTLSGVCFLVNPEIFTLWLTLNNDPLPWESVSLVTIVRKLAKGSSSPPTWPIYLIPMLVAGIATYLYLKRRQSFSSESALVLSITLGIATVPFGWGFYQVLLLVPYFYTLTHLIRSGDGCVNLNFSSLGLSLLCAAYLIGVFFVPPYWLVVFPFGLLLIWSYTRSLLKQQ